MQRCQRDFQALKASRKAFSGIAFRAAVQAAWIPSVVSKCLPFIGLFRRGNKKKSGEGGVAQLGCRPAAEALGCLLWSGSWSQERRCEPGRCRGATSSRLRCLVEPDWPFVWVFWALPRKTWHWRFVQEEQIHGERCLWCQKRQWASFSLWICSFLPFLGEETPSCASLFRDHTQRSMTRHLWLRYPKIGGHFHTCSNFLRTLPPLQLLVVSEHFWDHLRAHFAHVQMLRHNVMNRRFW